MKFLRTIRFDASDELVYDIAAEPEEWAVSGAFAFAHLPREAVAGKVKQAFANGFLGLESFGRSTFATVAESDGDDFARIEQRLAEHFVERYGAPGLEAALPAARDETEFVRDLCQGVFVNTVFTVRRFYDKTGEIKEEFRTIKAPGDQPLHTRIWSVVEDDG